MEIQTIAITTAFIGTSVAAIWDLKTTEVPDQLSYAMIAIAFILYGYQSIIDWNYQPILYSVIAGLPFLAFGFLMYYFGQWGGADALLLGSIGFLLPKVTFVQTQFTFPITYMINLFIVGAGYMLIYAFIFSLLNRKIFTKFFQQIKANSRIILIGIVGLFILFFTISWYMYKSIYGIPSFSTVFIFSLYPISLVVCVYLIWRFAKSVEDHGFKKKISVSKLRIGDMLVSEKKLIGITKEQLAKIKRSGKRYVEIKEGVRFAPAFPLALLFTLIYGDLIFIIFSLLI